MARRSATARRSRTKRPTARAKSARTGANVIIVGAPRRRRAVERVLACLDANIRPLDWDESVADATDDATLAIVLSELPRSGRPWRIVGTLHQILERSVPVAMLVPSNTSTNTIRRIYAAGAAVVFEWPRESLVLARVLAEMLGFELVRGAARKGDAALARAVVAHLRLVSPHLANLGVEIDGGVVWLGGAVDRLSQRHDAEQTVAAIPGVRGVLARGVRVRARVPDREIRQAVRRLLDRAAAPSGATVAIAVDAGTVALAGSVASKHDGDEVVDLVARIRGVKEIENDLVPSRARQAGDASVATHLRKIVRTIAPDERIDVAYFGGIAVLTGRVSSMSTRRVLTRAAGRLASVRRVIDKLVVVPRAR
jgi:osmotically-inducible protein OsmY